MDRSHCRRFLAVTRIASYTLTALISLVAAVVIIMVWRAPEAEAWLWRAREGHPTLSRVTPTLAAPLRWFDDYYVVGDMGEGAFAIGEPLYGQCNFSYLIVGSQRALEPGL